MLPDEFLPASERPVTAGVAVAGAYPLQSLNDMPDTDTRHVRDHVHTLSSAVYRASDDDAASCTSDARSNTSSAHSISHSRRMATAATAALQAREAEAARLKQRAQRLLRERSALACELEGLHEALTRTDRAIARCQEQTSALRAEASRMNTTDSRKHAAQTAAMAKAIGREKQRRLAARNELGGLQRSMTQRRAMADELAAQLVDAQQSAEALGKRKVDAEQLTREVQRLEAEIRECRYQLDAANASTGAPNRASKDSCARDGHGDNDGLRQELRATQESIGEERDAMLRLAAESPPARCKRDEPALRAQIDSLESSMTSSASGAADWRRRATSLHHQLHRLWAHERGPAERSRLEILDQTVVENSARWRAESQAFAAEARRVERAQAAAELARSAHREGWRDFSSATSATDDADQLRSSHEALTLAQSRLRGCRLEARELRTHEDDLRAELLELSNKELLLERTLNGLSAEIEV